MPSVSGSSMNNMVEQACNYLDAINGNVKNMNTLSLNNTLSPSDVLHFQDNLDKYSLALNLTSKAVGLGTKAINDLVTHTQ